MHPFKEMRFITLISFLVLAALPAMGQEAMLDHLFDGTESKSEGIRKFFLEERINPHLDRSLQGHAGDVYAVAYDPTGSTLVSVGEDRTAIIWDVATGQRVKTLFHFLTRDIRGKDVFGVAVSPDGTKIVMSSPGAAQRFDAKTVEWLDPILFVDRKSAPKISFSSDGSKFAAFDRFDRWVRVVDTNSGKTLNHFHVGGTGALAAFFSKDGGKLITIKGDAKGSVVAWDLDSKLPFGGQKLLSLGASVSHAVVSPDHSRLYVQFADRKSHRIWNEAWDIRRWIKTASLEAPLILGVAFSPNGDKIAATDIMSNRILILDANTLEALDILNVQPTLIGQTIAFNADGSRLAVASKGVIQIWRVDRTPEEKREFEKRRNERLSEFLSKPVDAIGPRPDGESADRRFKL